MQPSDREFVAPMGVQLSIDDCEVSVTPIVVAELFDLLALVEPIFDEIAALDLALIDRVVMAQLLVRTGEPLLQALAMCTRAHTVVSWDGEQAQRRRVAGVEHQQWINGLLVDRAAELLACVVEVNRDFFSRAMPRLRELPQRLGVAAPAQPEGSASAGVTPSSP